MGVTNTWRLLNTRHFRCGIEVLSILISYHSSLTYISQELELAPTCTIQYITVCGYDNSPNNVSC